eukprot:SAG25_NODE_11545_length_301_cov_1.495050_2_plen_60_part_01
MTEKFAAYPTLSCYYTHDACGCRYYTFNGTETPNGNENFSLVLTKVLFNISGTMESPVKN